MLYINVCSALNIAQHVLQMFKAIDLKTQYATILRIIIVYSLWRCALIEIFSLLTFAQ